MVRSWGLVALKSWSSALIGAVIAWVGLSAVLVATGVRPGESLASSGVIALNGVAFGVLWTTVRRTPVSVPEFMGIGVAVSTAVVVLLNLGWVTAGWGVMPWWVPALGILGALVLVPRWRALAQPPRHSSRETVAILVALALGLVVRISDVRQFRLYGSAPLDTIYPDIQLFESMGNAIARFGADESGLMAGWGFKYHWFGYAWSGWLSDAVSAEPFVVLTRVLPIMSMCVIAALAAAWAARVVPSRWAPAIVAVAVVVGTSIDYFSGDVIAWLSPSNAISSAWLIALMVVATVSVSTKTRSGTAILIVVLAAAVAGGKASHGFVAAAGAATYLGYAVAVNRRVWRRAAAVAALVFVPIGIVFLLVLAGQPSGGGLGAGVEGAQGAISTLSSLYGAAVVAVVGLGARAIRLVGIGYALTESRARLWMCTWWAVGGTAAAGAAFLLLPNKNSTNEWFLEAAAVLAAPTAAAAATLYLLRVRRLRRWRLAVLAAGSVAAVLALLARWLMRAEPTGQRPYLVVVVVGALLLVSAAGLSAIARGRSPLWANVLGWGAVLGVATSVALPLVTTGVWAISAEAHADPPRTRYSWANDRYLERADTNPELLQNLASAMDWLRSEAQPEDLLAVSDPVTSWPSALSGLRLYASFSEQVEAWIPGPVMEEFAIRSSRVSQYVASGDLVLRSELCAQGVRWLLHGVDRVRPVDRPGTTVEFGAVQLERLCAD